jgi:hypothetical protein
VITPRVIELSRNGNPCTLPGGKRHVERRREELMPSADERRLDNPVYAALRDAHSPFAQSRGRTLRYDPDVAPLSWLAGCSVGG